jgi:hypothetical protein
MSIISRRQTDGWPYAGGAVPLRMGQRGTTPHVSDNWLESVNGWTLSRELPGLPGREAESIGSCPFEPGKPGARHHGVFGRTGTVKSRSQSGFVHVRVPGRRGGLFSTWLPEYSSNSMD